MAGRRDGRVSRDVHIRAFPIYRSPPPTYVGFSRAPSTLLVQRRRRTTHIPARTYRRRNVPQTRIPQGVIETSPRRSAASSSRRDTQFSSIRRANRSPPEVQVGANTRVTPREMFLTRIDRESHLHERKIKEENNNDIFPFRFNLLIIQMQRVLIDGSR